MIEKMGKPGLAAPLFENWQETIIWSCLQGVMGEIYSDSQKTPTRAMAMLGDFCFFAGEPSRELACYKPERRGNNFMIMIPRDGRWAKLIEDCYREKAKKTTRYAIKKEPDSFNREALRRFAGVLPKEYILKIIDEPLFHQCQGEEWCRDLVSQYPDYESYKTHGLGIVALKEGEIVSGASSYSSYQGGIEIEIDTRADYRRRGLACACGAKLILECLDRGWYPSWDAQNLWSVALAEKLGYHFDHAYTAYEIWGY